MGRRDPSLRSGDTLPCLFERSEKSPCGRERLKGRPLTSLGATKRGLGVTIKGGLGVTKKERLGVTKRGSG